METQNVNISKEYLDKIRKFTAIRPDETFSYTPIVFRELAEDLRPVFTLRPISGEDALRLSDKMSGEIQFNNDQKTSTIVMHKGEFISAVCRKGVVRWEKFYDGSGQLVTYDGNLDPLPRQLLEELADAILSRASLETEELLGLR